jgi:hypothetical protein
MITEDYVSFEVAKLLKNKGFNEPCYTCYLNKEFSHYDYLSTNFELVDNAYSAPTLQMAMKWLRKKHLLHISIDMVNGGRWEYEIDDISSPFDGGVIPKYYCDKSFSSYEEAADDAIRYSLEHLIK